MAGAAKKHKSMDDLTAQINSEMKIIPDNFAEQLRKLGYEV